MRTRRSTTSWSSWAPASAPFALICDHDAAMVDGSDPDRPREASSADVVSIGPDNFASTRVRSAKASSTAERAVARSEVDAPERTAERYDTTPCSTDEAGRRYSSPRSSLRAKSILIDFSCRRNRVVVASGMANTTAITANFIQILAPVQRRNCSRRERGAVAGLGSGRCGVDPFPLVWTGWCSTISLTAVDTPTPQNAVPADSLWTQSAWRNRN